MPVYDYLCPTCGPFEERRPMVQSALAVACATCLVPAPRLPAAPRLNLMSSHNRYAETRNEKSAHEPDVVHRMADPHAASKGHGHAAASRGSHHSPGAHAHAHSHAARPSPRPWMIGH